MIVPIIVVSMLAAAAIIGAVIVKKLIHICQPNEVLVFAGTQRRVGNRKVGYRLVQGGRGLKLPLFESVSRLDLTNMVIDIKVEGAYSRGGIPLSVEGVANVKIASDEPTIGNAIVRFLGKPRAEITRVAKETLEGNLRGVLATLTPEEVNQDRVKFATSLLHEADADLKKLGIVLDTLKIQSVWDDVGYLDSLGRKQSADLIMRSRVAETENQALSAERSAQNLEEQQVARLTAELELVRAENDRRIVDAKTQRAARVAEERAVVTSEVAKAKAELDLQRARVEQTKLQLLADRVRPAEARRMEMVSQARGESGRIVEEGRATAAALKQVGAAWSAAGDQASRVWVAQNLGDLTSRILSTAQDLPVGRLAMVGGDMGSGGDMAMGAVVASEKLKQTLGVDVPKLLSGMATPSKKRR
jgi:flotillin